MSILAIESSCDESAIAFFSKERGIVGEWVHTQIALHKQHGGVIPGLAAREHLSNFRPLLEQALRECPEIRTAKVVAVTYGPGLAPCLALGIAMAKSIALALKIPIIGVSHLRGHAFSSFIPLFQNNPNEFQPMFDLLLPHLGLIVSGGNTLLFKIDKNRQISIIAQTVDDAAGEALDKGAKLLGMPYPGGPLIEELAKKGDKKAYHFPRAFPNASEMKFSFSGLKTSLRYKLELMDPVSIEAEKTNICASYQDAVIGQLLSKAKHALAHQQFSSIGLSGGVSNNQTLRNEFALLAEKRKLRLCLAKPSHTGDNASMIAFAAYLDNHGVNYKNLDLSFEPSLELSV